MCNSMALHPTTVVPCWAISVLSRQILPQTTVMTLAFLIMQCTLRRTLPSPFLPYTNERVYKRCLEKAEDDVEGFRYCICVKNYDHVMFCSRHWRKNLFHFCTMFFLYYVPTRVIYSIFQKITVLKWLKILAFAWYLIIVQCPGKYSFVKVNMWMMFQFHFVLSFDVEDLIRCC